MSRSQDIIESPCSKFLEWSSDNGEFKYWDKQKEETIAVKLPFEFIVLDQLNTIKGFSESAKSGIWSNEVRDLRTEPLKVRTSKGLIAEGTYEEIKDAVANEGGKYCKSVYILHNDEIWNIQLKGAAFGGWLDFTNKNKNRIYKEGVVCKEFLPEKKGKVSYTVPVFELVSISEEQNNLAKDMDVILQDYLKYYLSKSSSQETIMEKDY